MTRWRTSGRHRYDVLERRIDLKLIIFMTAIALAGCNPDDASSPDDAGNAARDAADFGDRSSLPDVFSDDAFPSDGGSPIVVLPAQFTEENMPLRMLREGDAIDLWAAPQGGHVVLVGAKVKNLGTDTAIMRVRVRYPDTPFIVAEEARSVKMVPVPGEPDTMQPELTTRTQVAHVPLCPDYDPMDIVDRPLEFVVQITDRATEPPRFGESTLRLHPSCAAAAPYELFCRCECTANYVLGKCSRDGGLADASALTRGPRP